MRIRKIGIFAYLTFLLRIERRHISPNFIMFAREVRAPADLLFGIPAGKFPSSDDDYSVEMENRM